MITPTTTVVSTQGAEPVPLELVWVLLRKWKREEFMLKLVLNVVFVLSFAFVTIAARPVSESYTILDSVLAQTAGEAFPNANFEKTFHHIANPPDWWEWVETVLTPMLLTEKYFNGDRRTESLDGRFRNTISVYNTLVMPLRFRQVRVTDDSCGIPAYASALSRPCWGDFSTEVQELEPFGTQYGNALMTLQSTMEGKEGFSRDYGYKAHVVDLKLDFNEARAVLAKMKDDLWLNEQTRAISIEAVLYNANVDLSVYARWHVDISASGRFQPWIEIHAMRLEPYGTDMDRVRLFVEIVFAMMLAHYLAVELGEIRAVGGRKYFSSLWNVLELGNLLLYMCVLGFWFSYLAQERKPFMSVSPETYRDLKPLAVHFNFMSKLAAFNIIFAFFKLFKFLQLYPACNALWRTLELSMVDVIPFAIIFMLFTMGFGFAAHWCFGLRMEVFHTLPRSFITLLSTLLSGLPFENMKIAAPEVAPVFLAGWVFVMVLVLINMFVAIIGDAHGLTNAEMSKEGKILLSKAGVNAELGFFTGFLRWLETKLKLRKHAGKKLTIFDADENAHEIRSFLKAKGKMRDAEAIRKKVLRREKIKANDITALFNGDVVAAMEFVSKLQKTYRPDTDISEGQYEERENAEQEELLDLQERMEMMEQHLQRCAMELQPKQQPLLQADQAAL